MGSKARFTKDILPIILKDRRKDQWYVELFSGGMNVICEVDGNRIANGELPTHTRGDGLGFKSHHSY